MQSASLRLLAKSFSTSAKSVLSPPWMMCLEVPFVSGVVLGKSLAQVGYTTGSWGVFAMHYWPVAV